MDDLNSILQKHDIRAPVEWNTEKPTRDGAQWFIGKQWEYQGKTYQQAWFGDYKTGLRETWKSAEKYSAAEKKEAEKYLADLLAKEKAEREANELQVALTVCDEWDTFAVNGSTPYLTRKQVKELYGARIMDNPGHDPILVVPARDIDGKLWNYQRIYASKLSKGDKFFVEGAKIDGTFHVIGDQGSHAALASLKPDGTIYICEGFATAASVYEAMGQGSVVIAAWNAGNLIHVATAFRERFPLGEILVCADNDAYTKRDGKPYNVGIEKARRAAGAIKSRIVYPIFRYPASGLTDFNDLHAAEGLDRVKDQILNPENYVKGIQPMCLPATRSGAPKTPTEKQVSDYILEYFGEKIVRQEKSLFLYDGLCWRELDVMGTDRFKQMIQVAANGTLGARDIETYYRYVMIHAPQVPGGVSLFKQNPFVSNFLNGTLHLGEKDVVFKPHDPQDFVTNVLPFEKPAWEPGQPLPPAKEFDEMIERLWANNADKKQVHALAHELIGACLTPAYPIIVFYHGPPNRGKSTFIKLLVKLVQPENVCSVQPCEMFGFNMETMIGKLVNFDTDIDTNKPINDSEVKKIIDRMPRRVRRKGIADVTAHLPAVHLFASNKLPKSLDGSSHAYGRRMIMVRTDSLILDGTEGFDFEQGLLDREMPGIVARGLEGLYRLREQKGRYTVPESSRDTVKDMELDSDFVGQFLGEVEGGEVGDAKKHKLALGPELRVERPNLWEMFKNWQEDSLPRGPWLGKKEFFGAMQNKGFEIVTVKGVRCFKGMGIVVGGESI